MPAVHFFNSDTIITRRLVDNLAETASYYDGFTHETLTNDTVSSTMSMFTRDSGLGNYASVDGAAILAAHQKRIIQLMCACMACFSIVAAICAIYWFTMMRRNYRRDLVLMLILGDFYKSMWYLIYGAVTFGRGQVQSGEPFCQISGFMLQTGLESCGEFA